MVVMHFSQGFVSLCVSTHFVLSWVYICLVLDMSCSIIHCMKI